jgi:heme exporter protein D
MRWESWSQFWDMGGYGLYVWGSMAVTALCMGLEVWLARQAQRQALALACTEAEAEEAS